MLTQEEVKRVFDYNPETGELFWRIKQRGSKGVGSIAGHLNKQSGYIQIKLNHIMRGGHQIVWLWYYGEWPEDEIDHIDHNRSNNRIDNLQISTHTQNARNRKRHPRNSSGYNGVHWYAPLQKWCAKIRVNSKNIHLGYFVNIKEAVKARQKANKKYGYHNNHGN